MWIPDHIESLDALHLNHDEYVISGSAAARLHQHSTTNTDIDITVPTAVCDRLLREHRIRPKRDAAQGWESLDGHIDINTSDTGVMKDSWETWWRTAVHIHGYTCLSLPALQSFYQRLASITQKPKHRDMAERLRTC